MSDFCQTCDPLLGGLAHVAPPHGVAWVVCECCGPTYVNYAGDCVWRGCVCSHDFCIHSGRMSGHHDRQLIISSHFTILPRRLADGGWSWWSWTVKVWTPSLTRYYRDVIHT